MGEHEGLKNLYQEVISDKFGWDRWGLLGVLSDYVLNYVEGDILEIGCGESSIYFAKLAEKYNRYCYHVEYSVSGVNNMMSTEGYFKKNKAGVYNMKSDNFFRDHTKAGKTPPIALAFIDGDHEYEQVKRDFDNTVPLMAKDGFIFLHDTYPPSPEWTAPSKCGTVFRLREDIEKNPDFEIFTFKKSAFDVGLSMVRKNEL